MLNEKTAKLLNTQINKELYSAYLYLHFANYYVEQGLNGFANWYQVQAQEERDHALLMVQYLQNNDSKVTFEAVAQPDAVLKENMEPLKAGLAHEQYVTSLIHTIYEAAYEAKDFRTMQFLDWFVKEQGEEEKNRLFQVRCFFSQIIEAARKRVAHCHCFWLLITFSLEKSSRSFSSSASVMNLIVASNCGIMMLCRAFARFCVFLIACAKR